MYERLLNKNDTPTEEFIKEYLGSSYEILLSLEEFLLSNYSLVKELKFPFGNNYGWGYKMRHKTSHLCYVFFESEAFTVTLQLGDNCVKKVENMLSGLSPNANGLWQNRYPCGKFGGWIHYRVTNKVDLQDVFEFIKAKKNPVLN